MASRDDRPDPPDEDEPRPTRRGEPGGERATGKIRIGEDFAHKYRVERILGSGGMGTVLRAFQPELSRHVAIKVMHTELMATEGAAKRFSLEARATASLKSKHTVRILDIDRLPNGTPFIVMEYLEGRDLATVVGEDGPLPVERATLYMLQAVDAIEEAHERGIIHRDLKPQNMILTSDGILKVVDFGLAKAIRAPDSRPADSANTNTNMLVGSPHYMSPEQMRSARDVDERTDIWALGATYYHFLTGLPPFVASSLHMLTSRIATEPLPPLATRRPDAPASVDAVLRRCLAKDPADRYLMARELRLALDEVMNDVNAARTIRQPIEARWSSYPATTRRGLPGLPSVDAEAETSPEPLSIDIDPEAGVPTARSELQRIPATTEPPPAIRSSTPDPAAANAAETLDMTKSTERND
ncbi:MAG: serine/threonine protein kinase [Deltaproteobacteria bacterium]|nr:serine/threonine protein kinase [Deltaproteobacteria bacterium]